MIRRRSKALNFQKQLLIYWITDTHLYPDDAKLMPEFVERVNADKPDLVIHTGDLIEADPAAFPLFMNYWNQIDPTIPKALTIGNHDLDKMSMQQIADETGYGTEALIAGSRFNQTFVVNGIRIIMYDSTNNALYAGKCDQEGQDWISGILTTCEESQAIIFTHHAPHLYWTPTPAFIEADAFALSDVVKNALTSNRTLQSVKCGYGHRHGNEELWTSTALGGHFPGYLATAAKDNFPWWYTDFKMSRTRTKFRQGE